MRAEEREVRAVRVASAQIGAETQGECFSAKIGVLEYPDIGCWDVVLDGLSGRLVASHADRDYSPEVDFMQGESLVLWQCWSEGEALSRYLRVVVGWLQCKEPLRLQGWQWQGGGVGGPQDS